MYGHWVVIVIVCVYLAVILWDTLAECVSTWGLFLCVIIWLFASMWLWLCEYWLNFICMYML